MKTIFIFNLMRDNIPSVSGAFVKPLATTERRPPFMTWVGRVGSSILVLLALQVVPVGIAAERTLFSADIDAGAEGKDYTKVNPDVTWLLNNGGMPMVRALSAPFATKPIGALEWNSGAHNKPSVLGVTTGHRDRYGQVFLRVARPAPSCGWLEIAVLGDKQLETKGPTLIWDPNGKFRRLTPTGEVILQASYPTNRLHEVTLNYDLSEQVFEVWFDQEQIVEGAPFVSDEFKGGASAAALGATWWDKPGTGSFITDWQWKTGDKPFTKPFPSKKP